MATNVVAYTRVSTDGQVGEDKFGLDVQRKQIEEYCAAHDMNVIYWYSDEGESGAKERPGFDAIVFGDCYGAAGAAPHGSNPPVEAVIVAKSDRVARDINIYYYYKMMLRKKDIKLISIAEDFGQFGVFGSMLEAFTLCVAEMERENIAKRTSGGRKMKAAGGGHAGGRATYGYRAVDRQLVIDEREAEAVRMLFEMRDKGSTLTAVADALNDAGYTPRSGSKFYASTVRQIEQNRPLYEGKYRYGGKDAKWVEGRHEAIL